ncbi:TolC family protein [Saccharicrinis sp. FJH62]|uniref:TolC family protein n=1 Tax=Saccharicrinis sp. FJH62 TaxID=3344657 RepID=UPI0035D3F6E3
MKKHKIILGILFLMLSSGIWAQEALNNYLQKAAENNPELKMKFNAYMAALEVAPQVKALPDPQVAFGYFIQPVETRLGPQRLKLSASQMFPWFGSLANKENAALQNAKSKYEGFKEAKSGLFNDVRNTYYNLYLNRKAIDITKENIGILETFRKLATVKVEAGLVSSLDEYRITIEINDLENQLALLNDKQKVLETTFYKLLNDDGTFLIDLPDSIWTNDFKLNREAALDSVLSRNHQLSVISYEQNALDYRKNIASDMGKPSFKVGLDYTIIGKGENNLAGTDAFMFPTIGVTIPLYRNKYKAMIKEANYLESAKQNEKIKKENQLSVLFENGWKDYQDASRRIQLYNTQLDLARKSLSLLETDYATGNRNFEEILRMERKVLTYNLELEKAKTDKQASISFFNYLMGN